MGISTKRDYIERLKKQKVAAIMGGQKIDNIVDNPHFAVGINSIAVSFDAANEAKYAELATLKSPLINEKISRWTHILRDEQDTIKKATLMRQVSSDYSCPCIVRCVTNDLLNTLWLTTFEMDKKYATTYHHRFVDLAKQVQRKDLVIGVTMVDPKGDRALRPSKQLDPDVYLRVVEKKSDGIVVRGAKAHSTAAVYCDMLCAVPSYPLREDEKDFAVAFFCPMDSEGVTFVCRSAPIPGEHKHLSNPISQKFGHAEVMVIYDDVFIPWERVLMCGEYDASITLLNTFSAFHMMSKCGCRSASMELDIGATALMADMNGVGRASHINNYILEMIMNTEIVFSCAISAAVQGTKHESGVYVPNLVPVHAGKAFAAKKLGEHRYYMQDTAGGLVQTMADEKDYLSPVIGKTLEKYYKGKSGVPTVHRVRAFKLIEELTSSPFAGWYHAMAISGGGGPEMLKQGIKANYDISRYIERAKKVAGIEE